MLTHFFVNFQLSMYNCIQNIWFSGYFLSIKDMILFMDAETWRHYGDDFWWALRNSDDVTFLNLYGIDL